MFSQDPEVFYDDVNNEVSIAEISRPRCRAWDNVNLKKSSYRPQEIDYDNELTVKIDVSPTFLDEAGWVDVTWTGLPLHFDPLSFWIGVYLEGEMVNYTAPIK
jgi:hypothetical protein